MALVAAATAPSTGPSTALAVSSAGAGSEVRRRRPLALCALFPRSFSSLALPVGKEILSLPSSQAAPRTSGLEAPTLRLTGHSVCLFARFIPHAASVCLPVASEERVG